MKMTSIWFDGAPDVKRSQALSKDETADVVVIGAGIVGATTAWLLAQEGIRVILLEKNHLATGDSGATTGFLTHVPDVSIDELIGRYGVAFVQAIFREARTAQQRLFKRIETKKIACDFVACESRYTGVQEPDATLEREWAAIRQVEPTAERELNFVRFPGEGKFHIRKYLGALIQEIAMFEESEVTAIELGKGVIVRTHEGSVQAKRAVVAVGDPSILFPQLQGIVEQILTHVVVASDEQPQIGEELIWDTRDPYYYYRRVSATTILLGGCDEPVGREMDQNPVACLKEFLHQRFGAPKEITHSWSGSLFETKDGLPYVFAFPGTDNRILVATGFGGNGLVFGSWSAEVLRDLILERQNPGIDLLNPNRTHLLIAPYAQSQSSGLPDVRHGRQTEASKKFLPFGRIDEMVEGRPVAKTLEGHTIMVVKLLGKYHAVDNRCTHAGGSLCDGDLKDTVVTCPLHGAKFDVTTGQVKGPPAVRSLNYYPTRVVNGILEIEIRASAPHQTSVSLQQDPFKKWRIPFLLIVTLFWVIEILAQRSLLTGQDFSYILLVASALTGATLISAALFSSAIFKWVPHTALWWRLRRYLGVSGFVFSLVHVLLVWSLVLKWDLSNYLFSFNPIENPMLFGSLAFPIFLIMMLTSNDWAVDKLSFKWWKRIHRLVYMAFPLLILHYVGMKPDLLSAWPGVLLFGVSMLALVGQIYWFFATLINKRGKTWGLPIGLMLIVTFSFIAYMALKAWKFL